MKMVIVYRVSSDDVCDFVSAWRLGFGQSLPSQFVSHKTLLDAHGCGGILFCLFSICIK